MTKFTHKGKQNAVKAARHRASLTGKVAILAAAVATSAMFSLRTCGSTSLPDGFVSPPKGNFPSMWVFKLGVDSPREVITYDLEEFAKVGISDFMIIGNGAAITAAKPYGEPALKGKIRCTARAPTVSAGPSTRRTG